MKAFLVLFSVLVLSASCAHKTEAESERAPALTRDDFGIVKSRPLRIEDTTIWTLQEMAQDGRTDLLNDLFNNYAIPLDKLPEGYAAGAGARVLDIDNAAVASVVDNLTGANWRGKIFFPSEDPKKSMGLNRIRHTLLMKTTVTPMASFVTQLLEKHPLVPEAKSNVVILNYAKPVTKKYWQELTLTKLQVYDVMVAVPGKYGPVFIGKTWFGKYAKDRSFSTEDRKQLNAWFFLDFNAAALAAQQKEHWDGSKENILNPIPHMKLSELPVMPN